MASFNRIVLIGKVLSEPEKRFSVDGQPIVKFKAPVSSGFNQPLSTIEVVCFQKLAEICGQYLRKGTSILLEGRIQVRSYEDQTGTRVWTTEIVASNIEFMDNIEKGQEQKTEAKEENVGSGFSEVEALPEDDLPF